MHRILAFVLLAACGGSVTLLAQITYQQSDYATVGDTFVLSQALPLPGLNLGQDGNGLAWDVSALTPNNQRIARFGDPDQAGYRLTWITECIFLGGNPFNCPSAWDALTNLSEDALDQSNLLFDLLPITFSDRTRHYQLSNNLLVERLLGLSIGNTFPIPLLIRFSQPDTLLRFPLSLGLQDSTTAAYEINYSSLGVPYASFTRLRRVRHVSGAGSLTTPFATYNQVLKLETRIERRDSIRYSPDSSVVLNQTLVEYTWFDPAYGHPVMAARGNVIAGQPLLTEIEYFDTLRCIDPQALFLALPNPVLYNVTTNSATVNFTSLSQSADSLAWNLGDGTFSDANSLSHAYTQPGLFPVQLIACNTTCSPPRCDTLTLPVAVVDTTQPLAFFSPNAPAGCVNQPLGFTNNSFNAVSYQWDFGDGSSPSTQPDPTHTYTQPGTYTVTLIATKNANTDTTTVEVRIRQAPTVSLGPDTTIALGNSVGLQSNVTGTPLTYLWTPPTGLSCLTCPNPTARPNATTTYQLTVTSNCGTASATQRVEVSGGTSVATPAGMALRFFPNPTAGALTVEAQSPEVLGWQVSDLLGRQLMQGQARTARLMIDLTPLPAGVYAVQVSTTRGIVRRLIQVEK
jgi:PKD repeat protein